MDNRTHIKLEAPHCGEERTIDNCIFLPDFLKNIKNEAATSANESGVDNGTSIKEEPFVSEVHFQNERQCYSTNLDDDDDDDYDEETKSNHYFEMDRKIIIKDEPVVSDAELSNECLESTSHGIKIKNSKTIDNDFKIDSKLLSGMPESVSEISLHENKCCSIDVAKQETVICFNRDEERITNPDIESQSQAPALPVTSQAGESEMSKDEVAEDVPSSESTRLYGGANRFAEVCIKDGNDDSIKPNRFHKCDGSMKEDQSHKCEICDLRFTQLGSLKRPKRTHLCVNSNEYKHGDMSYTEVGNLKTSNTLVHDGKRKNKCDVCDKSFTRLGYLKTHALIHEGKKPHKCDICGKRFTHLQSFRRHKFIHEGIKPHKCDVCEVSFAGLDDLKRHKLIHEAKKPYRCDVCGKRFTRLGYLKTHKLIHEGKKPHKCDICDMRFTQLGDLRRHKLIHDGKKPHKCDICDMTFTLLQSLKKHKLIHEGKKPHKCEVCYMSFTLLGNLKTHNLIHEGKKPHTCEICDIRFTHLQSLKRHKRIHEGKKPHKCDVCDMNFTRLEHLKNHKLIHK